jgi:hypothetical protein
MDCPRCGLPISTQHACWECRPVFVRPPRLNFARKREAWKTELVLTCLAMACLIALAIWG